MKRAVILAGGTGGHIYPGLAVAEALRASGVEVSWIGSEAKMAMEKNLVPPSIPLHMISARQLRNQRFVAKLMLPIYLLHAVAQAILLLRKIKPDVCIAFGGFVSGPASIAAKCLGIPLVIHEQNARAGLTNRYLAKVAQVVLQAFPNAFSSKVTGITVGNPIREAILNLPAPAVRLATHEGPLRILVLGGSLGALALNEAILNWVSNFSRCDEIQVTHQTGKAHGVQFQEVYEQKKLPVTVLPYIEDMPAVLSEHDLVICRAGALTVSEIAVVGIAAIFVPMPHAVDNHQFYNARYLVDESAALMIEQKDLTSIQLSLVVTPFLENRKLILNLSERARALGLRDATEQILKCVRDLVAKK